MSEDRYGTIEAIAPGESVVVGVADLRPGPIRLMPIEARGEVSALAAVAKARVEARYIMAERHPRDWDQVRARILKECKRPGFAELALYKKPIGRGIQGPSIRLAEAVLRAMGNIDVDPAISYDDAECRKIRLSVTDLEANLTHSREILISKTVERSSPESDGSYLSVRRNAQGKPVYRVNATEDELLQKEASLVSKALRTEGLRHLPADILEDAIRQVRATLENKAAEDPDKERKALADAFVALNVMPAALSAYLGHDLAQCSPAELADLRVVYTSIRDGQATWADYAAADEPQETLPGVPKSKRIVTKLKKQAES
jgi:hypothetical protein